MQLSQLLKRLTVVERTQLVKRIGAPPDIAKNPQALVSFLSSPYRLESIFLNLDSTAIALLKWIAVQPLLEGTWQALQTEIGSRASVDQVRSALQELRLWGLADFNIAQHGGFVATYAAVAQALNRNRASLAEHLERLNVEELGGICARLGAARPPTTKAARSQLIIEILSRADSVAAMLEKVSESTRALFLWVESSGGRVTPAQMARRYPGLNRRSLNEVQSAVHQRQARELAELMLYCLVIPLPDPSGWWVMAFAIPDEVRRALSKQEFFFDEQPLRPPALVPADARQVSSPEPTHLLRDVAHLLGFVSSGRGEFRQDRQPYQRSLQAFGKAIQSKDRSYPETLWRLCELSGLLRPASAREPPVDVSALGPHGLFWLLMDAWTSGNEEAAYYVPPVRLARQTVLQVLAIIPADTWVTRDSLEAYLHFSRPLLIAPPGAAQAQQLQGIEWGTLARLFVAVGEMSDGRAAVMIPAILQRLLTDRNHGASDILPEWSVSWHVQPDRTIVAPPNLHPYALMHFWQVAQLEENGGASIFRVTPATVAGALNRDIEPSRVRQILEEGSRTPLPDTVIRLLEDQSARYGQITLGPAQTYLRTVDSAILDELLHDRKLNNLAIRRLGPDIAFIDQLGPLAVREALRRAGYLPVLESTTSPGVGADGAGPAPARSGRAVTQASRFMRERVEDGRSTRVKWQDGDREESAVVDVRDVAGGAVRVTRQSDGMSVLIKLANVVEARVVVGEEDRDDLDDDEEGF